MPAGSLCPLAYCRPFHFTEKQTGIGIKSRFVGRKQKAYEAETSWLIYSLELLDLVDRLDLRML